jgi:hypothetical protein
MNDWMRLALRELGETPGRTALALAGGFVVGFVLVALIGG